eukprot:gnl/Spiro4/10481_TR5615_c0_g1_i1.p1 gnl/Spiro4/10481_TR5615_c0_g1~~gnl/Spiro4/10481_TR5615_c0_g1_i1.p1  ORF type:complete len:448 (+),score=89.98 gnl/Spiro4/10481_TR5615_c0_g1_i1:128-1471(+)
MDKQQTQREEGYYKLDAFYEDKEASAEILATQEPSPVPSGCCQKFLRWCQIAGPGLVVMLADTDAGCLITAGQSGSEWGYSLIILQVLLVPVVYMAQELTVRLGVFTHLGQAELIRVHYGKFWSWFAAILIVITCTGGVVSEMTGIVGVGEIIGVPHWASTLVGLLFLILVVFTGSYRRVEKIALAIGLFELVFVITMFMSWPSWADFIEHTHFPITNGSFLYLISANVGAVVMPWMIFYQQSAVVDRDLQPEDIPYSRIDTLVGAIMTQLVMTSVLMTAAGNIPYGTSLDTVTEFSNALTPQLGRVAGRVLFCMGMLGGALIGAIVVTLTATWTLGEVSGFGRAFEKGAAEAPWFYGVYTLVLLTGAGICLSGLNIVMLNVAVQVLNAALVPVVLFFLFACASNPNVLPPEIVLRGPYKYLIAVTFAMCSILGWVAGVYGVVTGNA